MYLLALATAAGTWFVAALYLVTVVATIFSFIAFSGAFTPDLNKPVAKRLNRVVLAATIAVSVWWELLFLRFVVEGCFSVYVIPVGSLRWTVYTSLWNWVVPFMLLPVSVMVWALVEWRLRRRGGVAYPVCSVLSNKK